MRWFPLVACCAFLAVPSLAIAGSMPALPELPPLPTDYVSQGAGGVYAGILAGYAHGPNTSLAIGLVVGNTVSAADLLLGVEGMAFASSQGEVTVEGSLRAGLSLSDTISIFGNAGVGYSFDTDAFVSIGASLEADMGSGWIVRGDYRYNLDLSGDLGTHKVLMGLVHKF